MDSDNLLGQFLRARRNVTTPQEAGMVSSRPRRTPGLRREEVALLAGVSNDYYIRLEQGRERNPSDQVLSALAQALNLDFDGVEHLYRLAHPGVRRPDTGDLPEQVSPSLVRLMRSWQNSPAFVVGRWMDVLASNPLADALYGGLSHTDNCLRMIFLSPVSHDFYGDWEKAASAKTAALRQAVGAHPHDRVLAGLVAELSEKSEEFRRLWERHDVRSRVNEVKAFHHQQVGRMSLTWEVFTVSGAPGQQLHVMSAVPDGTSERALATLGDIVDGTVPDPHDVLLG
ncbi:helix-turn-helix domain-containing protein [Sphaerisporangium sp. TRM90804]|uniref:helix-turn-helix domain-containing protein n=1 Tax=Sphaerisporangium sp. TRM90804 TaxID=3031113 RepID=UPI0024469717|nr:helix-turn-helix domain-containing protein [Sphaerisporangium sp. TRM90804]MDH2425966.1 helix-turn-helix domain-containing protein [Sphaerisporangium sp. TRM90804]